MSDITCIGFALGLMIAKCKTPDAAPTGRASFCAVMHRRGGKLRPSRQDTQQTVWDIEELNAVYDELKCGPTPFPKPGGSR